MSKRYSVESPNQSSSTPIKPALQGALGCLDVNLEAELTKYRKHRRRGQQWVSPSVHSNNPISGPDRPPSQNLPTVAEEVQQQPLPIRLAGVPGDAPMIAATKIGKPQKLSATASGPDSYLESSEKLIESLDEQTVETIEERSLAASLLTPLGLSSMLLFLLSCTALGYAVMHPSSAVKLVGLNRWLPNAPSTAESPASTAADTASKELPKAPNLASKEFVELDLSTLSNVKPTASPIPTPSPQVSLPPTPATIPNPTGLVPIPAEDGNPPRGSEQGMNNISTALLPSPSPAATVSVPTLPTLPPTPGPLPQTPAAAAPATPAAALGTPTRAADGFYYVVTDYTDEKSLAAARAAVPDAYVRKFLKGVKIQLGAVNDAASAERLAKELQAKGMKVQYDRP